MSEFIWQNSRIVERLEIPTPKDPFAAGLWLGDGLFETMLALQGALFARRRHIERFEISAQKLGIEVKDFDQGLEAALSWLDGGIGRVRLTQTSDGQVFIFAREYKFPTNPLKIVLYPEVVAKASSFSGIKSLSYGLNSVALRFARSQNADDVLFENERGEIMESSLANLLAWDGDHWWTPALSSGCLPGVTRQLLIEFFGVRERGLSVRDLLEMQALALTSSLRGVQPVSHFQGVSYSFDGEADRLRQDFANWREQNLNP